MPLADALLQIKFRRQQMANRKPLPNGGKRNTKWLHPVPVERQYQRDLEKYVTSLAAVIASTLFPHLQSLLDQRNALTPDTRADDWADDAIRLAETSSVGFAKVNVTVPGTAAEYAAKTNVWNDTQWRKVMHQAVGVDIHQREPWLGETLNSWTKENVALITKMGDDYKSQVEGMVQRGIRSGQSVKNLTKDIQERTGVTKSRARLIARDQVSKLNGQLAELRQTNIGLKSYIWRTSEDERVRSAHKANNGKTFSWSKPPLTTGHPGSDYQCRCWADPIFDEIEEEITKTEAELGWVLKEQREQGTVVKEYGSKASAQSMKSKVYKTAELKYNASTGKYELHIAPKGMAPVVPSGPVPMTISVGETKYGEYGSKASAQSVKSKKGLKGATVRLNPSTGKWEIWQSATKPSGFVIPPPPVAPPIPPQQFQAFTIKSYGSKASAQSMKSKVYKNATIQFNSVTGKWELRIPTGQAPVSTPVVKPAALTKSKAEIAGTEVTATQNGVPTSIRGYYVSDAGVEKELAEATQLSDRIPQQALNRVADYERKLRLLDYESSIIFDAKTGERIVETSQHMPSQVGQTAQSAKYMRDNIFTHNHPNSTPFSPADISNTIGTSGNVLQKRACSDEYIHIMERNPAFSNWWDAARANNPGEAITQESMNSYYAKIQLERNKYWTEQYKQGKTTRMGAFQSELHDVNEAMAKKYNYKYARYKNTESINDAAKKWDARMEFDAEPAHTGSRFY